VAGPIGLRFTETMRGYFSTEVHHDFESASPQGEQDSSICEFTLTMDSSDFDRMLKDPDCRNGDISEAVPVQFCH